MPCGTSESETGGKNFKDDAIVQEKQAPLVSARDLISLLPQPEK